MVDPTEFDGARLLGDYRIVEVSLTDKPILDPFGRPVIAQTRISGRDLFVTILRSADDKEFSVSLYHEVLEAMTVVSENPPEVVIDFNEADFERAGYQVHEQFGPASAANLNRMLQFYGFQGD
jgi:hypothetical protein